MKKHALLIGINEYSNLAHLSFAVQDAEEVGRALRDIYGFVDDELTILSCQQHGSFSPGRNNIRNHLRRIREIKKLDLLFIGFWGHGSIFASPSGSHERYLCANDTYENDLEDTGVSLGFLLDCLKRAGATDTCLILDCCQNLAGTRRVDAGLTQEDCEQISRGVRDIQAAVRVESDSERNSTTAILSSCSFRLRAHEWRERRHGVFTAHLLDAMQQLGRLTDWANYVSTKVPQTSSRLLGASQQPFPKIEGAGDIHFSAAMRAKLEAMPHDVEHFLAETRRKAEEEAERIIAEARKKAEILTKPKEDFSSAPAPAPATTSMESIDVDEYFRRAYAHAKSLFENSEQ